MNIAPTICRACGGRIEKPASDRHICEKCIAALAWPAATGKRLDDGDLTRKLWRLREKPTSFEWYIAFELAWKIGLYFFALATTAIIMYWLAKQAMLWFAAAIIYWLGKLAGLWG